MGRRSIQNYYFLVNHDSAWWRAKYFMFEYVRYCYGSWSLVDIRQDWTVSTDTHTHAYLCCKGLSKGGLTELYLSISVKMSNFPITPPAQGCQSTSQFSQPARGIWASTLPFQQQVRTSLLSRKAVVQQHVTNFEPVTCFEGAQNKEECAQIISNLVPGCFQFPLNSILSKLVPLKFNGWLPNDEVV